MEQFTSHTGTAVPLRRSNVDTDQIIPAVYLKRVTKTGFEDGLFAAWRSDPSFVLNQPQYAGATILIPGPDFGTGSSREHAVWALQNYGFKVVIGSRFGDIFRGNSGKAGLLIAVVDQKIVEELWDFVDKHEHIYVVEQNRDGQMAQLMRMEDPERSLKVRSVLQYDGLPVAPRNVSDIIAAKENQ